MSLIKCPRCQGNVSTMSGTCPTCGVRILGNITYCPECGATVLRSDTNCYACHAQLNPDVVSSEENESQVETNEPVAQPSRDWKKIGIVSSIIALLVIASGLAGYFFVRYQIHKSDLQHMEILYTRVMTVHDPELCKNFLDRYPDSPYREKVEEYLLSLQNEEAQWQIIHASPSIAAIDTFMTKYPMTAYADQCAHLRDSIVWHNVTAQDTEAAYQQFVQQYPQSAYFEQANERLNGLSRLHVSDNDVLKVSSFLTDFFTKAFVTHRPLDVRRCLADSVFTFCGNDTASVATLTRHALAQPEADVTRTDFQLAEQPVLQKEMQEDRSLVVSATFSMRVLYVRTDPTKPSNATYQGSVRLTEDLHLIDLDIKQTSANP